MKYFPLIFALFLHFGTVAQNVGINNSNPIGKLTINTPYANHNLPSLLLIDDANTNAGGAVLQFRNAVDKRMYLQSHFGTADNGSDSYLTFSYDGYYQMRLRGDGLLGIGTTTPAKAGLEINKKVGKVLGAFGTNEAGVAFESNVPGFHFNNYNNDGNRKAMIAGYGGGIEFSHTNGTMSFYNSTATVAIGANITTATNKLVIDRNGNVGIGVADPLSLLHINGNVKINGNSFLEFGQGLSKEINAGKIGYSLFTPQTLDIVGAGSNTQPRRIRFWAEDATEFTGNVDIFDSLKIRQLQTNASVPKRNVYIAANGLLQTDGTDIFYTTINVVDFKPIVIGNISALDKISEDGTDLMLFRNTNNAAFSGVGYFTYPLSKLPFGAKIVSVRVQYISKKPEINHSVTQLKARACVSLYRQFVDPIFGGTSIKIPVIGPYEYTESTFVWNKPAGGLNVTGTTVNNPDGFAAVDQNPTSIIVWSVAFAANGVPTTTSDFRNESYWPPNKALSFHSVVIGYKL